MVSGMQEGPKGLATRQVFQGPETLNSPTLSQGTVKGTLEHKGKKTHPQMTQMATDSEDRRIKRSWSRSQEPSVSSSV